MPNSQPQSQEPSSDWFSSDPAIYVQALDDFEQSLAQQDCQQQTGKEQEVETQETPPPLVHKRTHSELTGDYLNSHAYGAATFGGFGEYMVRKRAKLQVQNQTLTSGPGSETNPEIFQGVGIYVRGNLAAPVVSLTKSRSMVSPHLLFKKSARWSLRMAESFTLIWIGSRLCASLAFSHNVALIPRRTHIITSSLTPAKVVEFQRMKIVRPEWLVESVRARKLLPWQNYIFRPENRALSSINKAPAQKSLFSSKVTVTNDPVTEEKGAFPSYAAHKSNPNATRAIENPEWRVAHTSAAPDFIDGYYKNSRLHHLSTWKVELRKLVQEAQEHAERAPPGSSPKDSVQGLAFPPYNDTSTRGVGLVLKSPSKKGKEKARDQEYEQIIMHCDFDAFFVSVGLLDRKHLRGKPVVVCHSQGDQGGTSSTSEIASASYEAREFGIKNGMRYPDPFLQPALTLLRLR